jgi:hypothetical protein
MHRSDSNFSFAASNAHLKESMGGTDTYPKIPKLKEMSIQDQDIRQTDEDIEVVKIA